MIPSLLQIPSAVSDSKLHSVLPNNGKGDFQFERSTGATRINKDGLIEEVGYFSSELVQNGNFSELGSEIITNGDFANNSWWQLSSSNVNISNGKGNFTAGTTEYFYKTNILTIGKTYKVVFEITDYTTGYITAFGGSFGAAAVGVGTYIRYYTAVDTTFGLVGNTFVGSIDNVSVKQVDPNDRWTLGTGYTYGNGVVNSSSSDGNFLTSSATLVVGKTYKVSFDVTKTSGELRHYNGGFTGITANATGTFSGVFTPTETILRFYSSAFVGSVDNVSVVEVQGDRPRLSYDITNGVVEDKPHLLLEPSATNNITFSEDITTYGTSNATITSNVIKSPDGTINSDKVNFSVTSGFSRIFVSSSGNQTYSLYVKYDTLQHIMVYANGLGGGRHIDIKNRTIGGTVGSAYTFTIEDAGNDWSRITMFGTSAIGTSLEIYASTGTAYSPITIEGSVYIWGVQGEATAYATSYIPTAGTTITRSGETCTLTSATNLIGQTKGVAYMDFIAQNTTGQSQSHFWLGSSGSEIGLYGGAQFIFYSSGGVQINGGNIVTGQRYKIAFGYKANDYVAYINGAKVGVDTSATVPTMSAIALNSYFNGAEVQRKKIKGFALYNEALSESQLMQLTGVTASSIYNNFVTRTASFTVEALNEVKKVIDNL